MSDQYEEIYKSHAERKQTEAASMARDRMLDAIKATLEVADADLSWDKLPNRSRIQDAIKLLERLK